MILTASWSMAERDSYARSLTPTFQLTTQKLDGAGTVILMGPGECFFRNAAWDPVRRRRGSSFAPTTLEVLGSAPPPGPCHSTVRLWGTKPPTDSAISVIHDCRRNSPSVKISS